MTRLLAFAAVATACLFMFSVTVSAKPPANADPALSPWYQSLQSPSGGTCCSEADCRPVDSRQTKDGHWEALIGRQFGEDIVPHWEEVDPERILDHTPNPTGSAVACWIRYTMPKILCFVRPAEA